MVNPKRIELCDYAHVWIRQRPGTDVALFSAMARVILDAGLWDPEFVRARTENFDAWQAAGVANGGTAIEDPPGIRDAGFGKMYLAYLRDPDGNKLCGYYRIPADQ